MFYELGLNIEDSTMTRLGGEFAIMLVLSAHKKIETDNILGCLEDVRKAFSLSVACKPITKEDTRLDCQKPYLYRIIVFGYDKPGIVYKTSKLLASYRANIHDLRT